MQTPQPISALLPELPCAPIEAGEEFDPFVPFETVEAYNERRSREMRTDAAKAWFASMCPLDYLPERTDWNHPGLAPYAVQISKVREWQPGAKPHGLILSGDTYRGKSRALFALLYRLKVTELRECAFFTAATFFARMGEQVRYGTDDAQEWIAGIAKVEHLFIDDFGQEAMLASRAEWARAWFFALLDIRRGNGKPLFITTNMTAKQMAKNADDVRGDPMLSRLLDLCAPVRF